MKTRLLFLLGASILPAIVLMPVAAVAQTADNQPIPPERYQRDARGVDLVTGKFYFSSSELDIGDTAGGFGLSYSRVQRDRGYDDNYQTGIVSQGGYIIVSLGSTSDKFSPELGNSVNGTGAVLSSNAEGYIYTTSDGVVYQFSASVRSELNRIASQRVVSISYSNGRKVEIAYETGLIGTLQVSRPSTVSSNDGYRLLFAYRGGGEQDGLDEGTVGRWMTLAGVIASNTAEQNCTIQTCFLDHPTWNRARYSVSGGTETRTDAEGRLTDIIYDAASRIVAIKPAGYPANFITLAYDGANRVTSYTKGGATWQYAYTGTASEQTTVITAPSGLQTVVTSLPDRQLLTSVRTGTGGTTRYEYDANNRLSAVISPEGNRTNYTRDARDNVTGTVVVAKSGGEQISTSATFPASCTSGPCDTPLTTTDVRGQTVNYEYGPHGQVTKIVYPSAGNGAPSHQKTFDYQQFFAFVRDPSGTLVQSSSPIWKLTRTAECSTATECPGAASETVMEIAYGAAGQPNNLLPTSVTVRAGDNSITSTLTITYDLYGNAVAVDGPLVGNADTVTSRYNRMRELIGQIGAAPAVDGSGARRALRINRDDAGRVNLVESGTVNGVSESDWSNLAVSQSVQTEFDATGRRIAEVTRGGDLYHISNYAYDADDRVRCAARRSGPGSGDACVVLNGGNSPDDVRESVYGADGRVTTQRRNGIDVSSFGYTGNGQIASVADGKGNATTYQYDGFDRLLRTTYSDESYEYISRNAVGDPTNIRKRDASTISYEHDALGQTTSVLLPGGGANSNLSFSYDLLGRIASASNGNGQAPWTNSTTLSYDALGNLTSETSNLGGIGPRTTAYQSDAAGNRTRITWADGFFASYEYRPDNALQRVRENGATVLAEFGYDALGHRNALSRGNGTLTTYSYDALSQLTGLVHDLAGDSADVVYANTFDKTSRITIQTRSNDAYAWTGQIEADRSYSANPLNQYTQVGAGALGYDGRGNLTSDGNSGTTYSYDAFNQLTGSNRGAQLAYDALGRLSYTAVNDGGITRFAYAGDQLIAEYDASGNLVQRHVPATGNDDPIVSYGPQGRSYLYADERGSVVATADDAGNATQILSYDEYGIPGNSYSTRFQYTGQAWLPELGMAYYKARIYSPTLGRFMHTDPIGYDGGPNLYAYTGNDPVNNTDPTGLLTAQEIVVYGGGGGGGGSGGGDIVVTGTRYTGGFDFGGSWQNNFFQSYGDRPGLNPGELGGGAVAGEGEEITVTAPQKDIVVVGRRVAQGTLGLGLKIFGGPLSILQQLVSSTSTACIAMEGCSDPNIMSVLDKNRNKTVEEALRERKGSIKNAPLPKGSPSWSDIGKTTLGEIQARARAGEPGYKTIHKLLNDTRFIR
ncbi:RHS repeat-associated core domain-containing protein [Sphingomonas sp. PB2P12]|uniref:RHS repeat domain-containing protein n=1 Tax=Sphingomonas sandaracina TaxID=3096157 RepID=UPI002FC5EF38